MRTSNPVLSDRSIERAREEGGAGLGLDTATDQKVMTLDGVVIRTSLLLALVIGGAIVGWQAVGTNELGQLTIPGWLLPMALGLVGLGIFIGFKPTLAPYLSPPWAILEGIFVGAISAFYEGTYPGIVGQAVLATIVTAVVVMGLTASGVIRATPQFRKIVITATVGVAIFYVINMVLALIGIDAFGPVWDGGPFAIAFSLFVVVLAAANLVLDVDLIERGTREGWPGYMAWYAAFGLVLTLVWLYLEMLRLLSYLRN